MRLHCIESSCISNIDIRADFLNGLYSLLLIHSTCNTMKYVNESININFADGKLSTPIKLRLTAFCRS